MPRSRTAQYVALYRALEHRERVRRRLFEDPFAHRFLSRRLRLMIGPTRLRAVHARVSRYADERAPGARTSAIARTRFIDDLVRARIANGTTQLVILGAGYDTRAHRLAELSAAAVFEVDTPDTQRAKRATMGRAVPYDPVNYVAVDFLHDDLFAALRAAGWNEVGTTLFVWEGVTNYLTTSAVGTVLTGIGRATVGSVVVFTYVHAGLLDGTKAFEGGARILENVRKIGEPWTFGLQPREVGEFVRGCGLTLREELGADDYRARYLPDGPGNRGYAFYRLAVAER